jgi:hypothetical protein
MRALHAHETHSNGLDDGLSMRNAHRVPFIREVLAAWIMVLLAAAVAVLLLSFHEPRTDNRRLPRWHEPPVLDSGEWADDLLVRRGADWRCDIFLNCIQH